MSKLTVAFQSMLLSQVCVGFPKVLVLVGNLWSEEVERLSTVSKGRVL